MNLRLRCDLLTILRIVLCIVLRADVKPIVYGDCQLANDFRRGIGIAMPVQRAIGGLVGSISFVNFATPISVLTYKNAVRMIWKASLRRFCLELS